MQRLLFDRGRRFKHPFELLNQFWKEPPHDSENARVIYLFVVTEDHVSQTNDVFPGHFGVPVLEFPADASRRLTQHFEFPFDCKTDYFGPIRKKIIPRESFSSRTRVRAASSMSER